MTATTGPSVPVTIGAVLEADRYADLALFDPYSQSAPASVRRAAKPAAATLDLLDRRDAAARAGGTAWGVWRAVVIAVRTLQKEPPGWAGWAKVDDARAVHDLGCLRWAPSFARRVAPRRPIAVNRLAARLGRVGTADAESVGVARFWAVEVKPGGAKGCFRPPSDLRIVYTPELAGLVCPRCNGLMPLSPTGRESKRAVCGRCRTALDHAAWKRRSPDSVREAWRKATSTYRRRQRGEES